MKNIKLIFFFCCIVSTYFTSCGDPCKLKVPCSANGTCLEGLCSCSDGYEGESCDTMSSTKFIGHWKGQEIYYYDLRSDTVIVDWSVRNISTPLYVKIYTIYGNIFDLNLKNNKLTVKDEIVLDSLHIIRTGNVIINTKKDTLRYAFDYKAVGNAPGFYSRGVLVKMP